MLGGDFECDKVSNQEVFWINKVINAEGHSRSTLSNVLNGSYISKSTLQDYFMAFMKDVKNVCHETFKGFMSHSILKKY